MSHQRNGEYKTPKDEWGTPQWLFDLLDQEFHFSLDAAADGENRKCKAYFDKFISGLDHEWTRLSATFLNPPYSAGNIDRFMAKALKESQKGAVVVCLVPVASDTRWWHDYVMKSQEIRFIKGRVKFIGYDEQGNQIRNSPTFSSCVAIFDPNYTNPTFGNPRIGKTIEQPKTRKEA
jgi:site-specific DNA-methyltransferase (adenine-specific)